MVKLLFSVFDSKAGFFGFPMTFRSFGEAKRSFADVASDPKTQIGLHPEDFSLIYIGEYNESTGVFTNANHENLGTAASFVVDKPQKLDIVK